MDENKKAMYDKSGPRVAENFRKRHFEAYYCSDKETACQKVLELIPPEDTVSWGGSMTLRELGVIELLAERGNPVIDRDASRITGGEK